jgi:hypothetical protein
VKNKKDALRKSLLFVCIWACSLLALAQQNITITGVVTDASDAPLPGVNVTVKGTMTGVATDANG